MESSQTGSFCCEGVEPTLGLDPDDVGMLEDLILLAVNEALRLANEDASSSMSKITGGLDLGGFGL